MQEDTFGLRIFGRQQTKKMTAKLQNIKDLEAKKKLEEETEEERKKRVEEKKQADEDAAYAEVESDHHGRIHIDYRQPRPNLFPVSSTVSSPMHLCLIPVFLL